jgi:hypothetical protein
MSIIEKLTEGIVNRDMKAEGTALLNKWSATGLLEGLGPNTNRRQWLVFWKTKQKNFFVKLLA